jgi:hypothetical protein
MKIETLEALLTDRALGALPPEVGELLDFHLTLDPEAARLAKDLASTVKLARSAVGGSNVLAYSPPMDRVRRTLKVQRRKTAAWELSKLAACILLGLAVGVVSRSGGNPAAERPVAGADVRPLPVGDAADLAGGRNGFWSLANFAPKRPDQTAADARLESRHRLHWDSLVKLPHLEGSL